MSHSHKIMHEQLTINRQMPIIARFYDYDYFRYPWHFHSELEIIYVEEGKGERFVADSMEYFGSGDLILLGSNLPHYMRSSNIYYKGDASLRVKGVIIQFAHDYMHTAISEYAELNHIKLLLQKAKRGIHYPCPKNNEIIDLIKKMPVSDGVCQITNLLLLLDKMAAFPDKRVLGSLGFNERLSDFSDNRIEKVLSYLMYHYAEPLKLEDIASIIPMNATAFCRYFKEKTGKTYVEYIQGLRVGYACKLLVGTNHDISQISLECGFNTLCHFYKVFRRSTGLTPSDYRKQFLK